MNNKSLQQQIKEYREQTKMRTSIYVKIQFFTGVESVSLDVGKTFWLLSRTGINSSEAKERKKEKNERETEHWGE